MVWVEYGLYVVSYVHVLFNASGTLYIPERWHGTFTY
jgi:hypothetical protein